MERNPLTTWSDAAVGMKERVQVFPFNNVLAESVEIFLACSPIFVPLRFQKTLYTRKGWTMRSEKSNGCILKVGKSRWDSGGK